MIPAVAISTLNHVHVVLTRKPRGAQQSQPGGLLQHLVRDLTVDLLKSELANCWMLAAVSLPAVVAVPWQLKQRVRSGCSALTPLSRRSGAASVRRPGLAPEC